jgi:L-amino acid N-acyltransferase YncA
MNLQDLGSIGEMLGAVAVLVSFVYLARQIRQGSKAVDAATEQSITQGWALALSIPAQSAQNSKVYGRGMENPADLGFEVAGTFSEVSQKAGRFWDLCWLERPAAPER